VTSAIAVRPQPSIRCRGCSFIAFVLAPLPPIADWLAELDKWNRNSPDFFVGRPIILDLAAVPLDASGIAQLIAVLDACGIRIMNVEGVKPDQLAPSLPPLLQGAPHGRAGERRPSVRRRPQGVPGPPQRQEPNSPLIESPIRSGQSVIFPFGVVTVLGSASSGAEVVASGSIHVHGAFRGRVMAAPWATCGRGFSVPATKPS
jgi:septum site-determining protein MinC